MAESGSEEKTEEASPQKLRKARERGEVAKSQDLNTGLLLAVAIGALSYQLAPMAQALASMGKRCLQLTAEPNLSNDQLLEAAARAFDDGASSLVTILLLLGVFAFVFPFLQVGPLLTVDPLKLKLEKLNLLAGLKRLFFEMSAYIEFFKALLKAVSIGVLSWMVVRRRLDEVLSMGSISPLEAAKITASILGTVASWVVLFVLTIAVFDLLWQRFQFSKKMRMSKKEQQDEYKQDEGDPILKGQRKQMHQEISEGSMMEAVRCADVIVTNATHLACALRYDPDEEGSPRLLAKGQGAIAGKIREIAKAEGIPIMRDVSLVRALYEMELDEEIPEEMYEAVVEVLRWLEDVARSEGRAVKWKQEAGATEEPGTKD
ncbi:MAG: flagellar biosynthesis protein FlhB [Planctomycetota bacterium]|jgi:flagellar biosynthesis protein FlhB